MIGKSTNVSANPKSKDKCVCPLACLRKGECAVVVGLADISCDEQRAICQRLRELGFAPGEQVRVVAESFPRKDPMAVRIGNTMFALRRHEAEMVSVEHVDV